MIKKKILRVGRLADGPFVTFIFYNGSLVCLPVQSLPMQKVSSSRSRQTFDTYISLRLDVSSAQRRDDDKVAGREHWIRRSVFFRFNAIANKGLSNRRSTKEPIPLLPGSRCARRRSIPEECIGRSLERALALSRKVGRERVGGCAWRRRGERGVGGGGGAAQLGRWKGG